MALTEAQKEYQKKYREANKEKNIAYQKEYRVVNKEKLDEQDREYYLANQERIKEKSKNNYAENKEARAETGKAYREENKEMIKERTKKYRDNNKNKKSESDRKYRENNKEKINANKKEYEKNRKLNDPLFNLTVKIRSAIRASFVNNNHKKTSSTTDILGCSFEEFKLHLESKFEPWMNWENKGLYNRTLNYGWDVDHIIPLASAKTIEDIIKLNHHTNFQPLCSYTNRYLKKDKLNFHK